MCLNSKLDVISLLAILLDCFVQQICKAILNFTYPITSENAMKKIAAALLLAIPFCFHVAFAETAQQGKMATCNKDATGKKGDERKAFMKGCLSAKPAEPAVAEKPNTQTEKMKTCNVDAKGKKGDERKAFMKACLSNKPAAAATPAVAATPAAPATQQDKMKTCNVDAAGKKGDERKAFMKTCLQKAA